ncbi:hypothetical protein N7G274_001447 [Stereocaulon virgatum]|uniref:CWH43-like N-terminal domain-containing protein n=1 Tax=Stereocaulon virgatum TaxID=373712 RepID=A0ABR4AKK4_9LECA
MAVPITLRYGFIWILPLISAFTWLGMLLAMFIVWEREGSPRYASMDLNQRIAYISDIGAQGLKPLFIAGCAVTTVFLDLSFASERWLRHTGRLAKNLGMAEKILSGLSIVFAVAGTAGLILLSIFDTLRHPKLHDGFLLLFIAGYVISAIFICAEYQRLGIHFREHSILRFSFWMKLAFILFEVALAIIFGTTSFTKRKNIAAVFEWIIALVFTFYVLTFFVDLVPAARSKQERINIERMRMREAENGIAIRDGAGHANEMTNGTVKGIANGANGNAYTIGATGHEGVRAGQYKPPAAQSS